MEAAESGHGAREVEQEKSGFIKMNQKARNRQRKKQEASKEKETRRFVRKMTIKKSKCPRNPGKARSQAGGTGNIKHPQQSAKKNRGAAGPASCGLN